MRQLLEKARNVNPGYSPIEDDDDDRLDEQVGNHTLSKQECPLILDPLMI